MSFYINCFLQAAAEVFEKHKITFDQFAENPMIMFDPNLVFCIDHR